MRLVKMIHWRHNCASKQIQTVEQRHSDICIIQLVSGTKQSVTFSASFSKSNKSRMQKQKALSCMLSESLCSLYFGTHLLCLTELQLEGSQICDQVWLNWFQCGFLLHIACNYLQSKVDCVILLCQKQSAPFYVSVESTSEACYEIPAVCY